MQKNKNKEYIKFLEPIHEMYLNKSRYGWELGKYSLEPIHEMYLNSFSLSSVDNFRDPWTDTWDVFKSGSPLYVDLFNTLEPIHEMYLNPSSLLYTLLS